MESTLLAFLTGKKAISGKIVTLQIYLSSIRTVCPATNCL